MKKNLSLVVSITIVTLVLFYLSANAGREKAELIFSHKIHVLDNEMACNACHGPAESSALGTDNLMPDMESCGTCHDVESMENCGICHSDPQNARVVPRVTDIFPLFSHQMHVAGGLECKACHTGIEKKEVVHPYLLPVIESCQQCHTEKGVKPQSHGINYLHFHGDDSKIVVKAIPAQQTCRTCHSVQYCQNCHEGDNLDRTTHPLNYAFTHSLDAMGKENQCTVCHMERSFCIECHQQYQVLPHNHTAGWANAATGGRHASEARIDLENCMSCHEQNAQQTCQKCHAK